MLYPLVFFLMMLIVALKHSLWRSWVDRVRWQRIMGLMLDIALVTAAAALSVTYMIEIEAICLLDVITGDRERMIAEALQGEIEFAELAGLPVPDTVEDPFCLNTTAGLLPLIVFLCVVVFLLYNVKVWGLPLVLISILVSIYTMATILNWYFFGADGQNKYLDDHPQQRRTAQPRCGLRGLPRRAGQPLRRVLRAVHECPDADGFPYIVLGSLFGRCAEGQALIKLAFLLTGT